MNDQIAQNFCQQMLARSLQAMLQQIETIQTFTNHLRSRALGVLDLVIDMDITAMVWTHVHPLLLALSPKMEQSGFWDGWTPYLLSGLRTSETQADQQAQAAICVQLGIFEQRQGQLEKASEWFQRSIVCAKAVNDREIWVTALNRLGFMTSLQHKTEQASTYIEQALALMDDDDAQREYAYFVLGNIALSMHNPQEASAYFRKSFELCQQHDNKYLMAIRLSSMAVALRRQNLYQSALDAYSKCIDLWIELDNPIELAITNMNQGIVYENLNEPETALVYYAKAKPLLEQTLNSVNLARLYNNQGYCYYKLKKWSDAEMSYNAGIIQLRQLGNWIEYANILDGLGLVYREQGQWGKAIGAFEDALNILSDISDICAKQYLQKEVIEHLQESYARLAEMMIIRHWCHR